MDESKKIPKNFCVMPFLAGIIKTDGTIGICCNIKTGDIKNPLNIKKNTFDQWKNSEHRIKLQKEFLSGHKPIVCGRCWRQETIGEQSLRLNKNKNYKINYFKNIDSFFQKFPLDEGPVEWELQITNLCNLKCQMCSGKDSSKLLVENKKIFPLTNFPLDDGEKKEINFNQKTFDINDEGLKNIRGILNKKLIEVNFRGGEPLMIPKIETLLEYLIAEGIAKKIVLHITTNCTIINNNILHLLEKFKKVRLMISIDSTNKQNNYIRFPSEWLLIENNIKKYMSLKNINFYLISVVSNLSLLYLDQLLSFSIKNNFFTQLIILEDPDYMHFSILPKVLLKESLIKLKEIQKKIKNISKIQNFELLIELLELEILKESVDTYKWDKFKSMIKARDTYRQIHIQEYMPELAKFIYN